MAVSGHFGDVKKEKLIACIFWRHLQHITYANHINHMLTSIDHMQLTIITYYNMHIIYNTSNKVVEFCSLHILQIVSNLHSTWTRGNQVRQGNTMENWLNNLVA